MLTLKQISQILHCDLLIAGDVKAIKIDSRQIQPGDIFVAIRGTRFDGHDFMNEAINNGAIAIICEKTFANITQPQLQVVSTLGALTILATYYRQTLNSKVIALTGSNGKTTVKEMIAKILPQPAYASYGNFNNHIGVPLNMMQMTTEQKYAVFELGANHAGEIAHTAAIVQPHVALINNIGPAHIAGFGSISGVAAAKGEIYQELLPNGTAIINDDDEYANFWNDSLKNKKVLRFSAKKQHTDIYAKNIMFNDDGCATFELQTPIAHCQINLHVPGEHTINNALAAAACCSALDININNIQSGLMQFYGVKRRMMFLVGKNDTNVIDDTYNANLYSVLAAITVLSKRIGIKILVLGDLGELGVYTKEHHEQIGNVAKNQGINVVMTCGMYSQFTSAAFGNNGKHYDTQEALAEDLFNYLNKNVTVLIKGSRFAAMENIVQKIIKD